VSQFLECVNTICAITEVVAGYLRPIKEFGIAPTALPEQAPDRTPTWLSSLARLAAPLVLSKAMWRIFRSFCKGGC